MTATVADTSTDLGLTLHKDVAVPTRDGTVLRADVFRPTEPGRYPVIMTHGPYGKDIHFENFNPTAYALIEERGPFMNWETVNPEWWVPQGYVVIRVDSRGTGKSPGQMELVGPQEPRDFYDAIEWAGGQGWSNGKVGLLGISYYAIGQWAVAALRPPHLAAICVWEGAVELYREWAYHGGILSNAFTDAWWPRQITGNQNAAAGQENPGKAVGENVELPAVLREHRLLDDFYAERTPDLSAIEVPVLSAGNWAGYALHLRGNIEGWAAAGSAQKWLELHAGNHFAPFYSLESRLYQKRFLDHFLTSASDTWNEAPVKVFVRTPEGGDFRDEQEWPIARTVWTTVALDATTGTLAEAAGEAASVSYPAPDGGCVFYSAPFAEDTEVTGALSLALWVEADAQDMDVFVTLFYVGADGHEVSFEDASGLRGPITKGWLRVSHRELDEARSTPARPLHVHTSTAPLTPGEPVLAQVEIVPTSIVFRPGSRLGLAIESHDRVEPSRFLHNDPVDRSPLVFGGRNTIHTGGAYASSLLLPVIPPR